MGRVPLPKRAPRGGSVMLRSWTNSERRHRCRRGIIVRKAAKARRAAEGVTTRAIKARLDGLARDFDQLADAADSAAQTADAPAGVIRQEKRERG